MIALVSTVITCGLLAAVGFILLRRENANSESLRQPEGKPAYSHH